MKKLSTKVDSIPSDETKADSDTLLIANSSSHNSSKPNVVGSFNWANVSDNQYVITLIKQREELEKQIRAIDEMALVKYELEALQMS
jgi:hypothetical protein